VDDHDCLAHCNTDQVESAPGEPGCQTCVAHRIDGAYGDRNLVCSCPPVEAFA
jgi:hypothetical protein